MRVEAYQLQQFEGKLSTLPTSKEEEEEVEEIQRVCDENEDPKRGGWTTFPFVTG